jgi:hypothetical protein
VIHNSDLGGGELPCHFCDVLAQVCPYKQRYEALVFGGIPPGEVGLPSDIGGSGSYRAPYRAPHPSPLPASGERELRQGERGLRWLFWLLVMGCLGGLVVATLWA